MANASLEGFHVIVTGAAGLLGREHCQAIIEAGGHAIAVDVDDVGLVGLETNLKSRRLSTVVADITDRIQITKMWDELDLPAECRLGLVNNAAVNPKAEGDRAEFARLESLSLEQWNRELSVGLTGALVMTQIVGSAMAARGHGSIVNVSSDHGVIAPDQGLYGGPDSEQVKPVSYSVVKHGIIGLSRYTATYWAHRGVRVNSLSPGGVYAGQAAEFLERFAERVPLRRMARPDEYRGAVAFLLSDASSYMTGSNLVIDGGRSAW